MKKSIGWFVGVCVLTTPLFAQQPVRALAAQNAGDSLDSLVSHALAVNPRIATAEQRLAAAQAAEGPAGAMDDPMLMAGLMNQPIGRSREDMAMRVIGISQRIPYPGRLRLQRSAAEHEADAARAELLSARRSVEKDVKEAYYELAFLDRSREVLADNQDVLTDFLRVNEARYGAGTSSQADVLKARMELAGLAQDAVAIAAQRRAALAKIDALLDRPTDAPVDGADIPERIARAAIPADLGAIRFASAALGATATGSPVPPLASLQEQAIKQNPELQMHEAMIAAQDARVALAQKARLPDFDVSIQYGQRGGLRDLFSAVVSVPLPIHQGARQNLLIREAESTAAALRAEHMSSVNGLRADVAAAYADLERARTQLALFATAVLPQGRAALEASRAGFAGGRADFLTVLESQMTLYGYETSYHRAMTDFAIQLADLEQLVGGEVLR